MHIWPARRERSSAEAGDRGADIVCVLGPSERLGIRISGVDECIDCSLLNLGGAMGSTLDLQFGEECQEAPMSFVVVGASLGLPRAHRQQRLSAIQCLDLRFPIAIEHESHRHATPSADVPAFRVRYAHRHSVQCKAPWVRVFALPASYLAYRLTALLNCQENSATVH